MFQNPCDEREAMRWVVDFVTGSTRFCVRDNVAYEAKTDRPRYRIARNYWFELPSETGVPVLIDHDGLIYAYPPEGPPQFYRVMQPRW